MYCSHTCSSMSEIICNISVLLLQMLNVSRLYLYRCSSLPKYMWLQNKHSITVHHFCFYFNCFFTQDVETHRSNWLFLLTCYTFLLILLCFVVTNRSWRNGRRYSDTCERRAVLWVQDRGHHLYYTSDWTSKEGKEFPGRSWVPLWYLMY